MWRWTGSLVAGCCAVLCLPALPATGLLVASCVGCLVAGLATRQWWLATFALGAAWCTWGLHVALADRLDARLEGQVLRVRGTVVSVPQGTLEVLRFRFAPEPGIGRRLPATCELTWYDAPARVVAGERLELELKLRRPRGFANPGGADNEARMLRDRVGASGYVRSGTRLGRDAGAMLSYPVLLARAQVASVVRHALGDRPSAGIVAGLAVGLQDALSREQWLMLARSGTSHLMAISGLHIAMVAAIAARGGSRLQRWRQRRGALRAQRDVAVVAGTIAALLYSLLAGWSVPTQRTMVMIALGALAALSRRRLGLADGLGLCMALVVAMDPLAPLAPGFWLSFGAVAAILYGASGHVRRAQPWHAYLRVQWAVSLGLVPVLAASFGAVSVVSPLVNLYAIPLYTLLIVPAVLVSCAAALAWPAVGTALLQWTGSLVETTWPVIEWPARWSLATWSVAGLEPIFWIAAVVGVAAAVSPLPWAGRWAGVALVICACTTGPVPPEIGAARVSVLDVGQGLAAVVETHAHVLVFDTGPSFRSGSDAGQLVVVPFLHARGVRSLDVLVVSHDDDDHKGGAASVMSLVPTRRLVTGPSVWRETFQGSTPAPAPAQCRRDDRWSWDGVEFEWLHPGAGPYRRDNDSSCVLAVRTRDHAALLTADVETAGEAEMIQRRRLVRMEVVVAPHHGSRTSSSPDFVRATAPRWIVYSVGHRNRWNFPATAVAERWREAGARELQTSTSGAVTFDLRPGLPLAEPGRWRRDWPRIWRDP